tara:strand:+ start:956 stop:1291 length:336 start_codon:yes stop_codon:yes gene_type:complete
MENIIKKNLILISDKEASYVSKRNVLGKLTDNNIAVEFDNRKTARKFIKQWNSRKWIGEFRIEKKVSNLLKSGTIFSIYKRYGELERDVFKTIYEKDSLSGNKSFNRKLPL